MKPSEIANKVSSSKALHLELTPDQIKNFHTSFNINEDSEKQPAKIISKILNNTVVMNTKGRQNFRDFAPIFNDYKIGGTEANRDDLSIVKINTDMAKLCTQARELKTKDGKPSTLFLVPFKVADGSYCWTILSKESLKHQLDRAKGNKMKDSK